MFALLKHRALNGAMTAWLMAASGAAWSATADVTAGEDPLEKLTTAYARSVKPDPQVAAFSELFNTILQRVQRSYATDVDLPTIISAALKVIEPLPAESGDPATVFRRSINAALAELDPHSSYLDPRRQVEQRNDLSGSFGGLGIGVELAEGLVRINDPTPGAPAARAGLRNGDLIVQVDSQPVKGMALSDAVSRMRGNPGTAVSLTIRRPGQEDEFTVSLVREIIRAQTVRWSMEDDVLVLRLTSFTGTLGAMLERAVREATEQYSPRGVVIDMRNNPGGSLGQAVVAADMFLTQGEIVSLRGRTAGNRRSWKADAREVLSGLPMVVLINGASASAAELVAAALQENGRATVMGQRTYGKGSVQSVISLGEGKGALWLTTALYYGPSGKTVQRAGVGPDIELVVPNAPVGRGGRREADLPHAFDGGPEPSPPKASIDQARCVPPAPGKDAALACAVAYLKAGAIESFVAALGIEEQAATP